ncbi:PadR family transcriptional regulator [Enterobacteriaceae bacterium H18W14]|uniref:PadR family transcriptional regulator n=1 Tax=Dryocola boscaweniae TaxID=2925397 RepID=UPI0022F0CE75|nr:PadR family transcriptional regulator [Dryocola boscaweniae]MCT4717028.1 PadR family transcriptional regulator [Dryocola boscaweniae]
MRIHHFLHARHDKHERHGLHGGHGRHDGHPEGRGRSRRERLFDAQDIRLLILNFLSTGTAHGYELIKSIEALAKGEYVPSPGIIYPNLTLLEETGAIRAADSPGGKKIWELTEEGKAALEQQREEVTAVISRLASLGVLGDNRRIPEVQRAIHNFKIALNTRLAKGDIPKETLYKIIDTLDQAAKDIERS